MGILSSKPATTSPSASAAPTNDVKSWMRVQGLAQYADVLVDTNGYSDLEVLRGLDRPEQKKVASLCSMLPGHTAKFVHALSQTPESKQSTPPLPPFKKHKAKKPERSATDASYVAMIVDRSGSMRSMGAEVMNGFNTFFDGAKGTAWGVPRHNSAVRYGDRDAATRGSYR